MNAFDDPLCRTLADQALEPVKDHALNAPPSAP